MKKRLLLYTALVLFIYTFHGNTAIHKYDTVNLKRWQKVVIIYFHDFPQQYESLQNSPDCFFIPGLSTASDSIRKSVWRCRERISLLRPATLIRNWKQKQRANGAIDFNLPSAGINHVTAHIESASSIVNNILPVSSDSAGTEVVTGIFLRHSINVITYTFQSMLTGQLSKINATPEHLFYVKNRYAWIPLYKITAGMILTDNHNQPIRLLCPDDQRGHCGMPLHPGKITTIYNLEVYKKHVYFAGRQSLLVHNTYYDDLHPKGVPDSLQTISIRRLAEPLVSASYRQMIEELLGYKVHASFTDLHSVLSRRMDKAVKSYNLRMQEYNLAPYKLRYELSLSGSFNPVQNTRHRSQPSAYGFFKFYFMHTKYIYASDYFTPSWFNDPSPKKMLTLGWDITSFRESNESADPLLWTLRGHHSIRNNIQDFEKYSKIVHPHEFSDFDTRVFRDTMKKTFRHE